jgi:Glycosyltransferase family 87
VTRWRLYSSAIIVGLAALLVYALFAESASNLFAFDFRPYRLAADDVIHGRSPYSEPGGPLAYPYPYPPLVAFLATPFLLVPLATAEYAAVALSLVAVLAALGICGVRDVRCYALAALAAPTMLVSQLGNASALVCVLFALAWRYRSGVAAGASIAVKLIGWSLLFWLAAIGRTRQAFLGVGAALVLALVPWALIGFAGLLDYPAILAENEETWAHETYSIGGFGGPVAHATALVLAAACLYGCWRRGRAGDDAGSFALAIAAALVATPILWNFYFTLLLVAIAARRPRFHPVWLAPLVFWPLPNGVDVETWERLYALGAAGAIVAYLSRPWPFPARWRVGERTAAGQPAAPEVSAASR